VNITSRISHCAPRSQLYDYSKGGRTPTASRQGSRHETKDAVLLHLLFRLESAHRSSTCPRLVTSSLVDDMTSSSEEDILMYWCCSLCTDVWILTHRKGTCRVLLHVSAAWNWRQHHDSDRCATVFIISLVSTVLLFCVMSQTLCLDCYMSWRMPVCGLPNCLSYTLRIRTSPQLLLYRNHEIVEIHSFLYVTLPCLQFLHCVHSNGRNTAE
jgi:hypothetical protein